MGEHPEELIRRNGLRKIGHWEEGFLGKMLCYEGMLAGYEENTLPVWGKTELVLEGNHDVYASTQMWDRIARDTAKNPWLVAKQFNECVDRLGKELLAQAKKARETSTLEDLKLAFEWLRKLGIPLYGYHFIAAPIEEFFVAQLTPALKEKVDQIILPVPEVSVNVEKRELYALKQKGLPEKELEAHTRKWSWMGCCLYGGQFLTVADFRNRAKTVELPPTIEPIASDAHAELFSVIRKMAYAKFARIDYMNMALYELDPLLRERMRDLGFDEQLLRAMHPRELTGELPLPTAEELKNRNKGDLIIVHENQITWYGSKRAEKVLGMIERHALNETLSGRSVYPGVVRGRAVIVKGMDDCRHVQKGDIMICNETGTPFEPYMDRAAAVVAEIGGLLSHAAIFARERKKPTIVSCTGCTEAFASGDFVEVDADNGVVRKLS